MAKNKKLLTQTMTISIEGKGKPQEFTLVPVEGAPAHVEYRAGATVPTIQYGGVRCDVGITRPCKDTDKDIKSALDKIMKTVNHRLLLEAENLKRITGVLYE